MEYSVAKCRVIYFGNRNKGIDYFTNAELIQNSEVQRDESAGAGLPKD